MDDDFALASNAYAQSTRSIGASRGVEYQVFARVTGDLASANATPSDFPKLVEAAYENLRLWTTLAADISRDGNALPKELRSKLFYLYEFTRQHTRRALRGETSLDVLVEINTSVMRGLKAAPFVKEPA
ncbi:MAG: flagellar biosynthesis regulator FlaF [Rhodomicrobium sp.]|nr:flagellar biosynthesis regulator FlaF [Rhodomicrobium sp.]